MEVLPNGHTLDIPEGCFPLSTDSVALADFVRLPRRARVLDLGSGCGTLGLLLCDRDAQCRVTGVELDACAHQAALENILRNQLCPRMESVCADLRSVSVRFSPGSFDCCISNPPYFFGGPASRTVPLARRQDACPPEAVFQAAAWAIRYGGDFFVVHRPESLAQLTALGAGQGLEAKRLRLLRHRPGGPVCLILLQFRKGAKPGLKWEEAVIAPTHAEAGSAQRYGVAGDNPSPHKR